MYVRLRVAAHRTPDGRDGRAGQASVRGLRPGDSASLNPGILTISITQDERRCIRDSSAPNPGFPFCLSRMAPLYTRPPPRARNSVRRTIVQLQRLSLSPCHLARRYAPDRRQRDRRTEARLAREPVSVVRVWAAPCGAVVLSSGPPPSPMIPTWPGGSTVSRPSLGSSHRVREKPPARRPRVVVEEPAQSRPAPAAASGARWDRLAYQDPSLRPP